MSILLYYNTNCISSDCSPCPVSWLFLRLRCLVVLLGRKTWLFSTQPIYLIAQEVTKGIEKPTLLLADQSGHDVSLTPMHRKIIQDAGLVIWLGQAHEAPLDKLLTPNDKAVCYFRFRHYQCLTTT